MECANYFPEEAELLWRRVDVFNNLLSVKWSVEVVMKILLAGSTGAIGLRFIGRLQDEGESLIGMAHSASAANALTEGGIQSVIADALDSASVTDAVRRVRPDVIVNELTALPKHNTAEAMREAAPRDRTVRLAGNANLLSAAQSFGVRRYILQSSAFWYAPGSGLADEAAAFAFDAPPAIASGTRTYAGLESSLAESSILERVVLRYGFFYGPGTWYTKEGDMGQQVRLRQVPIIGEGSGVWSFVHVEDAAAATVAALYSAPGIYNVVDDDPSEQRVWLPAFAHWVGALEPLKIPEKQALQSTGADGVYYATRLRGASNENAKRVLNFRPRPLEWLRIERP
jgi:2-alkyl-3-oxoalkanoate reductase